MEEKPARKKENQYTMKKEESWSTSAKAEAEVGK